MHTQLASANHAEGLSRRELLRRGLTTGLALSALPLPRPSPLWGAEAVQPKRGGLLRVRGYESMEMLGVTSKLR